MNSYTSRCHLLLGVHLGHASSLKSSPNVRVYETLHERHLITTLCAIPLYELSTDAISNSNSFMALASRCLTTFTSNNLAVDNFFLTMFFLTASCDQCVVSKLLETAAPNFLSESDVSFVRPL